MVPTDRGGLIAPAHLGEGIFKYVAAEITRHEELVIVVEPVVDLGIQIVEIETVVPQRFFGREREKHIGIGPAAGEDKRTAVPDHRSFDRQPACNQSDASVYFEFFRISFIHPHVEHGGEPAAVIRRDIAFVEFYLTDRIIIEHRKEAHEMRGVVHSGFIEQDEVLVGRAATHAESRRSFANRLHARQELDGLDHIHLAHQRGNLLDRFNVHPEGAHFSFYHILVALFAGDDHLIELVFGRRQLQRQPHVARQIDLPFDGGIPDK